jgi:hypothetical protein
VVSVIAAGIGFSAASHYLANFRSTGSSQHWLQWPAQGTRYSAWQTGKHDFVRRLLAVSIRDHLPCIYAILPALAETSAPPSWLAVALGSAVFLPPEFSFGRTCRGTFHGGEFSAA